MWQLSSSAQLLGLLLLCCFTQNSRVFCADDSQVPATEVSSSQPLDDEVGSGNDGPEPEVIDVKDLPPFPILRNRLLDTENEVETFNGYHYDRPDIPFEDTNVNQVQFDGYSYPKPGNPLMYPDRTTPEEEQRNLLPGNPPESEGTSNQGPPVIDLPEDSIRILDDDVVAVEDEATNDDATDAPNAK